MTKTVYERAFLPAPPEELYDSYLDPERHGQIISATVTISAEVGSTFTAFDDQVRGRTIHLEPGRLIIQEWGSVQMGPGHVVVFAFDAAESGTEISLLHTGIPDDKLHLVDWPGRYWEPWRASLKSA